MNNMKRNPFFLPSGFEPQEVINIIEATGDNKKRLDKIKGRKREEIIRANLQKHCAPLLKIIQGKQATKKSKTDQIQRGYDLAKEWGWDGINRPYTPMIISVFGGSKRKRG